MYKVMIIDDEPAIRKLLRATIDWNRLTMEFAGEAASGIEAINIIDEIRPDVCFVDIRMPFMNGIEFSKLAIKRYPMLKIIILTAFDEFEYARECIGIGITDYQLKPIVKKDINDLLLRIKENLDSEDRTDTQGKEPESGSEKLMDKIVEYIKENYSVSDLNLTKVALEFGFNTSYLSRKFKYETGKNFVDFLFSIRMEEAKKLAKSGKPMYQTAAEVGIPDPNYFSKCFKKYVECTYSDYAAGVSEAAVETTSSITTDSV